MTQIETTQIEITQPDDWHLHLRDGTLMAAVVQPTARQFGRAIVMPNLAVPVTTVAKANAYRESILAALPSGHHFDPLMTLYLTADTSPSEIERIASEGYGADGVSYSDEAEARLKYFEANEKFKAGKKFHWYHIVLRPPVVFIYRYFYKQGFRELARNHI